MAVAFGMEPAFMHRMKYRAERYRRSLMSAGLLTLFALLALPLHAEELGVELRLPESPIHPGQTALISAVLSGVEAGKLYSLLPPAEENNPAISWGTLEWRGLRTTPGEPLPLLELALIPGSTGEFELPSLQLRAIPVAEATGLTGESVDLGTAVVVPTKPVTVTVRPPPKYTVWGGWAGRPRSHSSRRRGAKASASALSTRATGKAQYGQILGQKGIWR